MATNFHRCFKTCQQFCSSLFREALVQLFRLAKYKFRPIAQPAQKFMGAKMFDFRGITLFCLGYRLSKHKMTIFMF